MMCQHLQESYSYRKCRYNVATKKVTRKFTAYRHKIFRKIDVRSKKLWIEQKAVEQHNSKYPLDTIYS